MENDFHPFSASENAQKIFHPFSASENEQEISDPVNPLKMHSEFYCRILPYVRKCSEFYH